MRDFLQARRVAALEPAFGGCQPLLLYTMGPKKKTIVKGNCHYVVSPPKKQLVDYHRRSSIAEHAITPQIFHIFLPSTDNRAAYGGDPVRTMFTDKFWNNAIISFLILFLGPVSPFLSIHVPYPSLSFLIVGAISFNSTRL